MVYFKSIDTDRQEEEIMHTEAIASSHEKNASQLMLPFIEGDYWYYNIAETEPYAQMLEINRLLERAASLFTDDIL